MNKLCPRVALLFLTYTSFALAQAQLSWQPTLTGSNALAFALNPLDSRIMYVTAAGDFLVSYDEGVNWQTRSQLLPAREIRNIAICPADTSVIVIYASGNLLRSEDGGYTWDIVLEGISMDGETIEFHPTEPDTVFFVDFYGGNLWVSGDRGASWDFRANTALSTVCSYSINPNNPKLMIAGSGNTRINRSMDGGFTWTTVKDGNDYFSETPKIKWDPTVADRAFGSNYLDENYSVIKIEEGGTKYSRNGIYGFNMWALDINPSGHVFLGTFGETENSGVYTSYDQGNSWQRLGNIPNQYVWMIKTANDSVVNALSLNSTFGVGGIYQLKIPKLGYVSGKLTDSISGLAVEYYQIEISSSGDLIYSGNSNGTYKLALLPGTYSLTFKAAGIQETVNNVEVVAGQEIVKNAEISLNIRNLILSGTVKGENDESVQSVITLQYSKPTAETIFITDSTDTSGFFEFKNLYSLNDYNQLTITPLVLPFFEKTFTTFDVDSLQTIHVEYADVLLANGINDIKITEIYAKALERNTYSSAAVNLFSDPQNIDPNIVSKTKKNTVIWFGRSDSLMPDNNILDSLQSIMNAGYNVIMSGQNMLEYNQEHSIFSGLGINHAGNYEIDGFADPIFGVAGNPIGNDLTLTIRLANQLSADMLSISGDSVYKAFFYGNSPADSNNIAGVNISNTGQGGKAIVMGFDLDYQTPNAVSEVLKRSIDYFDGVVTSVKGKIVVHPKQFQLFQNYPNPFNPTTKIRFNLATAGKVDITVFDLTGRQIATLVSRHKMSAGFHTIEWNGRTSSGRDAASGVYFYTLKAGNFSQTKKMILIR